jgi:hypothetical protein
VAEAVERANGVRSDDAVDCDSRVGLEVAHGALRKRAEDAVDGADGEPERVESTLHGADILTVEERIAEVEKPVAEGERGVNQGGPGMGPYLAVLIESAFTLEGPDGCEGRSEEDAVDAGGSQLGPERYEATLNVFDGDATVALTDRSQAGPSVIVE